MNPNRKNKRIRQTQDPHPEFRPKKQEQLKTLEAVCPYCGKKAIITTMDKVLERGDATVKIFCCPNYPECDSYVTINNMRPVTLANKELRTLRREAHFWFDKVFELGIMDERNARILLGALLGVQDPHFGIIREGSCLMAIDYFKKMVENHPKYQPLKEKAPE